MNTIDTPLYAFGITVVNASLFWELCIGINFGYQQNTRYLQICEVEIKTVMDCYQECNIQSKLRTFENKTDWVMLSPVDILL